MTRISVIFDRDKGMKIGVASPYLEAVAAIIDPELTLSCPSGLTAATGADALTHLIEAFTGHFRGTRLSREAVLDRLARAITP